MTRRPEPTRDRVYSQCDACASAAALRLRTGSKTDAAATARGRQAMTCWGSDSGDSAVIGVCVDVRPQCSNSPGRARNPVRLCTTELLTLSFFASREDSRGTLGHC